MGKKSLKFSQGHEGVLDVFHLSLQISWPLSLPGPCLEGWSSSLRKREEVFFAPVLSHLIVVGSECFPEGLSASTGPSREAQCPLQVPNCLNLRG